MNNDKNRVFNVGVLGIGDISDVYINNLKLYGDIVRVVACAGRSLEKAQQKAAAHGIPKAYANAEQLLADPDIDILLNLTVPGVHAELNLAALQAGKHVYTEKPLAANFADSQKIMDLAKLKGLYLGSAPDTFMGGRLQTCRRVMDEGLIGDIIGASAFVVSHGQEWFHPNPDFIYKDGAGPLLDIGPYYIVALLALLGPVKHCSAMSSRAFATRPVESGPLRGSTIDVEVDTHITGTMEFASGAIGSFITSFDVWDSELPRMEIYGTKGTLCMNDIDPLDGPNLFGGKVLLRTRDNYRWQGMPRLDSAVRSEWIEVPCEHPFNSTSHAENSRGIGLIDMAFAIRQQREERASGAMALHSLELMEGLLWSAKARQFCELKTTFERPAPLPVDFPASE
ncbi:Gfo/Idh/MocA family protein [Marinobacterium sedimentorum]|uniref:Gfo/Idh/MocA family protein n=1 Tax=Marinobacterium sedimentorum TaxID=2927804 RepID=UPI0020C68597|nr:Gfo/Idh/MocA family oxidoreductase [Marinobacterium sedimentorum]MCP8688830.1 Gfo/Idh/MocA family oxidoreductase [Marinobacterium sedimentorum]